MNGGDMGTVLGLSLKIAFLATTMNLPLALMTVYLLSRFTFRGKSLVEGIINLPLVMPPVTTGYLLLLIFGRRGLLGRILYDQWGITVAFSTFAAVLAAMVVSFPLVVRSIRSAMDMVDPRLEKAASTLGAGKFQVFLRVTLPLVLTGIINGALLGFARSLGEFGATMTFAGNIAGETRTIPLAVYSKLQVPGMERQAMVLVGLSIGLSLGAMFLSSRINKRVSPGRNYSA